MDEDREPTPVSEISVTGLLQPGQRVGRYEVCARLAAGGMATVYLARAEGPGGWKKLVALKCIHPHLVEQEGFVEMFLDEARVASRVAHPNVIEVFDFGFADGTYFIAMGHLLGEPVSRIRRRLDSIAERSATLRFMLKIMADVAAGLHAVHEMRDDEGRPLEVVHRDVSPGNVFVTYDGAVKLLDFGIARALDQLHHTRTGTLKGTVAYMSPEQMAHGPVDRRSDLFAWGAITWELLAGESLFRRATEIATMRAVLDQPIPSLASRRPDLPVALVALVDACLSRLPSGRPATAFDVSTALTAIAEEAGQVVDAHALGVWMREAFPSRYAEQQQRVEGARKMMVRPGARPLVASPDDPGTKPVVAAARRGAATWIALATVAAGGAGALVWTRPRKEVPPPAAASPPGPIVVVESPPPRPPAPVVAPPPEPPAKPRVRRPAGPVPIGEGLVNVTTPGGWADVYRGHERLGRTPTQLRLPAGPQRLVLKPFGRAGAAIERRVDVERDQATRLVVPLVPPP